MPRPCAVESHVRHYEEGWSGFGMPRPCAVEVHVKLLQQPLTFGPRAANVKLHGASPWHLSRFDGLLTAASVSLHGASPRHLSVFSHSLFSRVVFAVRVRYDWRLQEILSFTELRSCRAVCFANAYLLLPFEFVKRLQPAKIFPAVGYLICFAQ